jgi:hypothetical protein
MNLNCSLKRFGEWKVNFHEILLLTVSEKTYEPVEKVATGPIGGP